MTFRPWTDKLPVSPNDGLFLVRAKLTLADGRVLDGFVTPQIGTEAVDLGIIQPQVFLTVRYSERFLGWDVQRRRKSTKEFLH
jgi:hypothetical protein